MNPLSDARAAQRDVLTAAGFFAFTAAPDRATPPFIAVGPGSPYIEFTSDPSLFFGEALVRHVMVCVVGAGDNDTQAASLDELLIGVLALRDQFAPFSVESVDDPGRIAINGQDHLGVVINLVAPVQLGV